ncbi:hypothetical protein GBAR_LOCUS29225 [Geodia barretti]|uniref:PH domain-containing protein n=1 Tax=Geodia barretti TaxID=519541 RepID=A0AA35XIB5_GEOBA|nr:hypothetical protein GBAR_LOCUS29225 [Geodia barretti]
MQKEREKQEKKLEKERKKLEENERKQREREAKINAKEQPQQNGAEATGEKSTGEQTTKENGAPASPPQSPPGADAAAETAATTSTVNGHQRPVSAHCWPEKVKVAEPPGQITGFGEPIAIIFDATRAGEGPMSASCTGASVGAVPVAVSEPWSAIFNVHFTPNSADVYTLSVKWGGVDIAGSPFTINLSRLSDTNGGSCSWIAPACNAGCRGKEEGGRKEQRQKTAASFSSEGSSGSQPYPSQQHRETPPSSSYQPVPGVTTHGGGVPAANQPLPLPMGYPSTKADVSYLDEINKKLQQANDGLGQEVANLKKKMGEFEEKLSNIELTSRAAEDERKELSANISLRGWLYKRGIKGPTANVWRHRYFRCDQGNKIYYYKSADEPTPKGCIDLEKVESVSEVESDAQQESESEKFCFNLVDYGHSVPEELASEEQICL